MTTIAFDADDTLWHNETLFLNTQQELAQIIARYRDDNVSEAALYATEMRNLKTYGYGVKGFALSMIETAIELTNGQVSGHEIGAIITMAKTMIAAPVELLPGVADVIPTLAQQYRLILITKGDLFLQESKVARSGLGDYFSTIEIVSEKDESTYARIIKRYGIAPADFIMVGNSPKSDILPVLAVGGRAVHIPYVVTWAHEHAELAAPTGYHRLHDMHALPALLAAWEV